MLKECGLYKVLSAMELVFSIQNTNVCHIANTLKTNKSLFNQIKKKDKLNAEILCSGIK